MSVMDGGAPPATPLIEEGDEQQGPRSKLSEWCERFAVAVVFTVFVVFRAADRAFLYRVQKYLQDPTYNLILTNVIWPIAIQLMTVMMLLGYIVMLRQQGHTQYSWRFFLPGNAAASSMGAVPMYQLALFSIGDQINAAMQAPPSPYVSLPMQSIMSNFVLVWMLGLAMVWLGTRFKQVHYIGCAGIILSVLVGISKKLMVNDCSDEGLQQGDCLTSFKTANHTYERLSASAMALWYGVFLMSTLPSAVSNCYKQRVLKGKDVDVCYATWWSGNWQIIWGLGLFWVNWIPLPDQTVPTPGQTFELISNTWECFTGGIPRPGVDDSCGAPEGPAAKWFLVYLCFNLTFNICLLWLTKRMSAVWAQIATTLCLDLTNIFSQWKFLVGDSAMPMSFAEWLGTATATLALWTYNVEDEIQAGPDEVQPAVMPMMGTHSVVSFTGSNRGTASFASDGHGTLQSLSFQGSGSHRGKRSSRRQAERA
eukprot:TRINITY_DN6829_c0_g1_i1.p1 TRINITY_DN6829_c0_g1~~TRINITY_DN6829_c0_g1_i1.p1  ORF type:complete len:480 (+),score=87.61 TRINITY_DN6829_c0_g1_i1:77-1516(+)